jgi:oligoendopeptidase F
MHIPEEAGYAWISSPGYFSHTAPFYNFPYTFGFLFSAILYSEYKSQPTVEAKAAFADKFLDALSAGGTKTPEELATGLGIDLTNAATWQKGLNVVRGFVNKVVYGEAPAPDQTPQPKP